MVMLNELDFTAADAEARNTHRRQLCLPVKASNRSADASAGSTDVVLMDLSKRGFLMQASIAAQVGDVLEITLPESETIEATVAWSSNDQYGCEFRSPLNQGKVSALLLQSPALHGQDAARPDRGTGQGYSPRFKLATVSTLAVLSWALVIGAVKLAF